MSIDAIGGNDTQSVTLPAIETNPLTTESSPEPEEESGLFDLAKPFVREVFAKRRGRKIRVRHAVAQPTLKQIQDRDESNAYRSQSSGTDEDKVLNEVTGQHDALLYNHLVIETEGYALNVTPGQTAEERAAALADSNIPKQHKIDIMRSSLTVRAEVVWDGVENEDEVAEGETFSWGDNIEYRVRVEFGDQAQFIVYVSIREPRQKQLDDYGTESTDMFLEKGHRVPVTKIKAKIGPAVELFNELIVSGEGMEVDGQPFEAKNPSHVALFSAYAKRQVLDAVIKETKLDLGNF